jgi:hypothetical protein
MLLRTIDVNLSAFAALVALVFIAGIRADCVSDVGAVLVLGPHDASASL